MSFFETSAEVGLGWVAPIAGGQLYGWGMGALRAPNMPQIMQNSGWLSRRILNYTSGTSTIPAFNSPQLSVFAKYFPYQKPINTGARGFIRNAAMRSAESRYYRAEADAVWKLMKGEYAAARKVGGGIFASAGKSISNTNSLFGPTAARGAMLMKVGSVLSTAANIYQLGSLALFAGSAAGSLLTGLAKDYSRPEYGTRFLDTEQAFTQRQAGLAAIHNSQLQTRSLFGREASAYHQ